MGRVCVQLSAASALLLVLLFMAGASANPQVMMQSPGSDGGEDGLSYGNDSVEIPVRVVPGAGLPLPQEVIQVEDDVPEAPVMSGGRDWNAGRYDPDRNEEYVIQGDPDSGTLVRQGVLYDEGPKQVMGYETTANPSDYDDYYPRPQPPRIKRPDWEYPGWNHSGPSYPGYPGMGYETTPRSWYRQRNSTTRRRKATSYPYPPTRKWRPGPIPNGTWYDRDTTPDPIRGWPQATSTPSIIYPNEPVPNCRCVCRHRPTPPPPPPPVWEPVRTDSEWERQLRQGQGVVNPDSLKPGDEHMNKPRELYEEGRADQKRLIWIVVGTLLGLVVLIVVIVACLFFFLRGKKRKGAVLAAGAGGGGPAAAPGRKASAGGASGAGQPVTVPMEVAVEGTSAGSSG